jgi:transposase
MSSLDYIGFDIHKKTISYCAKAADGEIRDEGELPARRDALTTWAKARPRPWVGGMEATLFTGWIYDHLRPFAQAQTVAHPPMLKAIGAAKKKNDRVDARKIADLLRCNLLPECYMAPEEIRSLRRVLRYRGLLVRQATRMKNRISSLLMETGSLYNKRRLHGKAYFSDLLKNIEDVPASVKELLRLSRGQVEMLASIQNRLLKALRENQPLQERVKRLQSIPGVGEIVALTWALEIGEVERFSAIDKAASYCGLTSADRNSAGKQERGPISKQRNRQLQTILVEAAKLAPRYNPSLAAVHQRELQRGDCNRATLAVARKLVAYLMAVDKSGKPFHLRTKPVDAQQTPPVPPSPSSMVDSAAETDRQGSAMNSLRSALTGSPGVATPPAKRAKGENKRDGCVGRPFPARGAS